MRYFILLVVLLSSISSVAQENINLELVGHYETLSSANDIWGYVDEDGIEYAIVGTQDDTNVFSLEDPTAPELLLTIAGSNTIWRDMKSYGDYVYSVTDATQDGLTVIDMSNPSQGIEHSIYYPVVPDIAGDSIIVNAHNLYIDENGILYMTGGNLLGGAPIFLDLKVDAFRPPVIGYLNDGYSHDVFVRGDTLYSSEIFNGQISLYDISSKSSPIKLGAATTSFDFTHNAWLSDDGKTVFTTDERQNAFVDAYDISDVDNIRRISMIRPRKDGDGVMPHNTHYHQGFLVTSWYGDGVIVIDAHKPDNLVIVGRYDTNPDASVAGVGCWGAYPFLPSGLVLASDRQNGLFVLQPNYPRASYLEGCITDALTGEGINGVSIDIQNTQVNGITDINGGFKTGHDSEGIFEVTVSKNGYKKQVVVIDLEAGELTELKLALEPAALLSLTIQVVDKSDGTPIPAAQVTYTSTGLSVSGQTDDRGEFFTTTYEDTYEFVIGAWGYLHQVETRDVLNSEPIVLELERGYQDDYLFDLGWEVPVLSEWERVNNGDDVENDLGDFHYQNWSPLESYSFTSPAMDLTIYDRPVVNFDVRLFTSDAFLAPTLIVDGEEFVLEEISSTDFLWKRYSYPLMGLTTTPLTEAYLKFDHQVISGSTHRAEVDAFLVTEGMPSSVSETERFSITASPLITDRIVHLQSSEDRIRQLAIFNLKGELIYAKNNINHYSHDIDLSNNAAGVYFINVSGENGLSETIKVIRL